MIITVDTGATKTLVAGADSRGRFHTRYRFPTPKDPAEYIAQLTDIIREHFDTAKVQAISIAVPGATDKGIAVQCGNLGWKNVPIIHPIASTLKTKVPLFLGNDADFAGLAETHFCTPLPKLSIYVTVSTGIGTGVYNNGKLIDQLSLFEGGKIMVEYDGIVRQWESFSSGRAIYETYGRYARDITSRAVWEQIADKIARGLLVLIPTYEPDVLIIGGSIGTYFEKYHTYLDGILRQFIPEYMQKTRVMAARYPEEAVIYGCRLYAEQHLH
jgi:predicted NBD/HSP70 family sugar kinase